MRLITLQPDNSFLLEGEEIQFRDIMNFKFRVHRGNGDIEIYENREDMPPPVIAFDLDSYKQQVNEAHNALFRKLYTERNYLSIGEIPLWFADPDFGEEAVGLSHWWFDTCNLVSNYLDSVTEETAQPVEQFIQSLPSFTV